MLELAAAAMIAMHQDAAPDPRLDWWREARFGMFIHWGLYAVPAGTWGEGTGHAEWIRTTAQIPLDTYDQFRMDFNPVKFDADAWCAMAADAGMGYVVITSKHHDGFCLFDSQHTDFDIMSTPFKRDIMAELADAAPRHGVRMCWYHSIMDWHHPDYIPRRGWETDRSSDGADLDRFRKYLAAQITELLTKYGPVGIMWFDGEWESTWRGAYGAELYELCRELQPDIIVNNRLGARGGMAGLTGMDGYSGGYSGDYATPEQEIPDAVEQGLDWETCMTMNDRWGYNAHDKNFKSTTDLLQKLCDIVSKNGNFLLNVGPKADGTFPRESIERLSQIGDWMDVNGEAIHGTTGSPFSSLPWGRATRKSDGDRTTLYLHVFDWPRHGTLSISGLAGDVQSARILGNPHFPAAIKAHDGEVTISVPLKAPSQHVSVVAIELEGDPVIYQTPAIHVAAAEFVSTMEVACRVASDDLAIHYTTDGSEPTIGSPRYEGPFGVSDTTTVKARSFHDGAAVSSSAAMTLQRVAPWPALTNAPSDTGSLLLQRYLGNWDALPDFAAASPPVQSQEPSITAEPGNEFEGRVYSGRFRVDLCEVYRFALESDDGSRLYVDDYLVIDNDGLHGPQVLTGTAPLAAGWHEIRLEWFNKSGGATLDLQLAPLGKTLAVLASEDMATPPSQQER